MKIVVIILVLILVVIGAVLIFSPKAPADVQSIEVTNATSTEQTTTDENKLSANIELTDFSFVGYGPGKSHVGKFENYEVKNVHLSDKGIPVGGELIIQTNSIKTDSSILDGHLCEKENFFNCAKYSEIKFVLSNVTATSENSYQVSGNLSVKDVTKNISFAVNGSSDKTFSSEFKLKMSDFGFSAPGIVDDEVLIKFSGKII